MNTEQTGTAKATETKHETNGFLERIDAFLNLTALTLALTYTFAPDLETIEFPVRIMMNDDELNARQAFYSQPAEAQNSGRHKYHVDMLCSILTGAPKGLPGWTEFVADIVAEASFPGDAECLRRYLMRGGPVAELIATDAIEQYNRRTKPVEFFR